MSAKWTKVAERVRLAFCTVALGSLALFVGCQNEPTSPASTAQPVTPPSGAAGVRPPATVFLHGSGATANPTTLFLDAVAPLGTTAKYTDSPALQFAGGNAWKNLGTWTAAPTLVNGTLTALGDVQAFIGLQNSDDIGTNFDLRVELSKNGALVASGEAVCIQGVTRNPADAKAVVAAFAPISPVSFNGSTDVLALKLLARLGTNGTGGSCGGHSSAVGLRSYFDAATRPAAWALTSRIAFVSDRDGNAEIYGMNANGTVIRLTNNAVSDLDPAWSPDGTKIAFASDRDGSFEIYVMNADGTGVTRLTNNPAIDDAPAWSPDGTKIAFQSDRDGNRQIYVMKADGSGVTQLTNNPIVNLEPTWSPDGTKIAFVHLHKISNIPITFSSDIDVMNADGSGITQLTPTPPARGLEHGPAWSPDGTKIAFASIRDGNPEIYLMHADGAGVTRLTSNAVSDADPAWSPDSKIAFASDRDGNSEIYVMNGDGSNPTRLTNNPASDTEPA